MDRRVAWIAVVLVVLAFPPAAALAQGVATDGAVTLTYPMTHWSSEPVASLQGTEPIAASSFVTQMGWFYRAQGDTSEHRLGNPDSQTYTGGQVSATWNDLDGKGFRVVESTYVFDNEGPSGGVWSTLNVTNTTAVAQSIAIFHYFDGDLMDTVDADSGEQIALHYFRFTDGGAVVRYRARGAAHFQVATPAVLHTALANAAVNDLDDSGLPFGPGDVAAAFEREVTLPPAVSFNLQISLTSQMPGDLVEASLADMTTYPALLRRTGGGYVEQAMRRTVMLGTNFSGSLAAGQEFVDLDDFDGDLDNDVLSRDPLTGETRVSGQVVTGAASPPPNWKASATGDWNGDGKADILWRNTTSQQLAVWLMNGKARTSAVAPDPDHAVDANWEVAGSADFDGDGLRDILWYNQTSGNIVIWYMDAAVHRITGAFTTPASVGDNNWRVVAVGDFGRGAGGIVAAADIVWQNDTSKKLVVWHMDHSGARTSGVFTTPDNIGGIVVIGPR